MLTTLLCAGLALALALLLALHVRLGDLPIAVRAALRRERDQAAPRASIRARVGDGSPGTRPQRIEGAP